VITTAAAVRRYECSLAAKARAGVDFDFQPLFEAVKAISGDCAKHYQHID